MTNTSDPEWGREISYRVWCPAGEGSYDEDSLKRPSAAAFAEYKEYINSERALESPRSKKEKENKKPRFGYPTLVNKYI